MSDIPIPSTPLQVVLNFNQVDAPSSTPHVLAGAAGAFTRAVLLSQLKPEAQPALNKLLTTPLQNVFDDMWTSMNNSPDPRQRPANMISDALRDAESRAYAINVYVPPKGQLFAVSGDVSSGIRAKFPNQMPGHQLTLSYRLPGIAAIFNVTNPLFGSWADPRMKLTFDGTFIVAVAVPSSPRWPLGIFTQFDTDNASVDSDTFFSGVERTLGNVVAFFKAAFDGNSVTGGGGVAATQTVTSVPAQLSDLSGAFQVAWNYGFHLLDVDVTPSPVPGSEPGNTVELLLTRPQPPGPAIHVDDSPENAFSQIKLDPATVYAGDHVTINGSTAARQRATAAVIYGAVFNLGNTIDAEWGQLQAPNTPPPSTTKKMLMRSGPSHNFTITSLSPNTPYGIRVRRYDVPGIMASDWGPWLYFKTATSDQSHIDVISPSGTTVATGTATIDVDTAQFTTAITIPPASPAGTYIVRASIPDDKSAQATLRVFKPGSALPPMISWDLGGTLDTIEVQSRPVTLYGKHWAPFDIDLYVDSIQGTHLGTAWGSPPDFSFKIDVTFPDGGREVGPHEVLAVQKATNYTAKCSVYYYGPPR